MKRFVLNTTKDKLFQHEIKGAGRLYFGQQIFKGFFYKVCHNNACITKTVFLRTFPEFADELVGLL